MSQPPKNNDLEAGNTYLIALNKLHYLFFEKLIISSLFHLKKMGCSN